MVESIRQRFLRRTKLKIDFSAVVTDLAGKPFVSTDPEKKGEPLTLKEACMLALLNTNPDERIGGMEKFKRGKLADDLYVVENIMDLKAPEVSLLKRLAGELFVPPLLTFRIWTLLDPDESCPVEEKKK